ncbi:flavodoxin family protein [Cellulomonas bogoriensis]|uniref:Flavodoxin/nitric oxide synthase n=1 Tax=Cellulomonas bogoriensis 69B4 = DSM 16987 TaxID=1386082 RepID=A0A0A0C1K8_9CELL|nr:flavodoxin domain-containing protein [Cellulomonas bogoriensis]KGM13224.1 flavodoxin/nitric oxide synthase [Cellulomonas bogoriensis 69B4 = DSM 16987]
MSRALVVYESMFGSTRLVAEAVARGLAESVETMLVEVGTDCAVPGAPLPADVDLLVVGGPTHAFGMSREQTRAEASQQAQDDQHPSSTGIREWIESLEALPQTPVATFATKVDKRWLPGSAARASAKALKAKGAVQACPSRDFWVLGTTEGLRDGELDEARQWGTRLAGTVGGA